MTTLGIVFPPDHPPEQLDAVARAADRAGLEQLWLWEDCFAESGIATAAAALARTERLVVGIGLLPVPLRNVALTAMEIATLARLFPGRIVAGVGHGVLDWMGQAGARVRSPMTLLREYTTALRALLHGETVTSEGRYVRLREVALTWPPSPPPALLVGGIGERTLRLAGELGDGVILTGQAGPDEVAPASAAVRAGRVDAGRDDERPAAVVSFVALDAALSAAQAAETLTAYTDAGATHVIVLAVGDDVPPLAEYVAFLTEGVRPLLA